MSESASGEADSGTTGKGKSSSHECEWCGDVLSNSSGLRRHKRLKHPDKLEHHCPTCGDPYTSERAVKLHHKRTHGESLSYTTATCEYCGCEFEYKWHKRPNPTYCDEDCRDKGQVGERGSNWRGGKETVVCECCEDTFKVDPHKSDSAKYCSEACFGAAHREEMVGENNPSWSGGKVRYYGKNWTRQRRKRREYDNYTCQDCGVSEDELGCELSVHHIIPLREFKDKYDSPKWYNKGNDLDNLVSFCEACHKKWEGIPLRPQ